MTTRPHPVRSALGLAAALGLATLACAIPIPGDSGEPTATEVANAATTTPSGASPTAAPAASETPTVAPSATPLTVTVTANGANLTLRRGPALACDTLGYLANGQTSQATGRNASSDWLVVERPSAPGQYGWVYLGRYAAVEGAVESLPVVSADPAVPAYLRNCTFHPMRIMPGDIILPERFNEPNNVHQVNPGTYEAYDMNQEGNPRVFADDVHEGETVDIITDGLGNSYPCP
ncbi:MAG: hypothetical protein AB1449_03540 [Chloroflexota bacterium]